MKKPTASVTSRNEMKLVLLTAELSPDVGKCVKDVEANKCSKQHNGRKSFTFFYRIFKESGGGVSRLFSLYGYLCVSVVPADKWSSVQ